MEEKDKTYKVAVLGCRTNQYEGQAFRDQMTALGIRQARDDEIADVCIVNTCTVTEGADASSRHAIRQMAKKNPGSKLLVTGCLAQHRSEEILSIPGVAHVVPNDKKEALIQIAFPDKDPPEFSIKNFEAHTRAFIKVQDGCNSYCTYCVIPYVRGRSRSRTVPSIVQEVEELVRQGFKEFVLTGINVGDFDGGVDEGIEPIRLAELVRIVDAISGVKRLRISSIDPDEVDEDLALSVVQGKHTCHSMHIVLQSGSNKVLKRMNRKYTKQIFFETVRTLRAYDPDFTFTTDVIVGFPGETEEDFRDTIEVLEVVQFAKVHMFPYSDRPMTKASKYFTDKVPVPVIQQRKAQVLKTAEEQAFLLREQFIGRTFFILIEDEPSDMPGFISGHTENFLQVFIPKENFVSNQIIEVLLVENAPNGFIGKAIGAHLL